MNFTKMTKLWGVYNSTSTCATFIRGAYEIDPDFDATLLRAVWHAFEVAAEQSRQPRVERERFDEPSKRKAAQGGRR
jgi:hypothetical protein